MTPEEKKLIEKGFTWQGHWASIDVREAETALKMARRYAWAKNNCNILHGHPMGESQDKPTIKIVGYCNDDLDAYIDEQLEKEK